MYIYSVYKQVLVRLTTNQVISKVHEWTQSLFNKPNTQKP